MDWLPHLREHFLLKGVSYSAVHSDKFYNPKDPTLEGSHIHNCYEIYVNVTGDISFLANNQVQRVKRGDIVFTRPGDVHVCIYNQACHHNHYCLWISAKENSPLSDFFEKENFQHFLSFEDKDKKTILSLFQQLTTPALSNVEQTIALLQIIELLQRKSKPNFSLAVNKIPKGLQSVLDYIDEQYANIRFIQDVCAQHYVSSATLNRWFSNYLQISPREYLLSKKLSAAKTLLDSGASVTETHIQLGFSDCSHFISAFKKKFGITPFRYKNAPNIHDYNQDE